MISIDERLRSVLEKYFSWTICGGEVKIDTNKQLDQAITEIKKVFVRMLPEETDMFYEYGSHRCSYAKGYNAYRQAILTKLEGRNETT